MFLDRGKPGIAHRLALTRQALGYQKGDFAAAAGIANNTYTQYESATNMPDMERANMLCDRYRLTLDWIFRGDTASLPRETRIAIVALQDLRVKSAE